MELEGVTLMPGLSSVPSVSSGELRHRVLFQAPVSVQDAAGGDTVAWGEVVTAWARIEPLTGRELFTAQQVYPEANTRITVRGPIGALLDVTMRAYFHNRQFDILDIGDTEERRIEAIITAIERPPGRNV